MLTLINASGCLVSFTNANKYHKAIYLSLLPCRDDFKPFSKRVGNALASLLPSYMKVHNLQQLRKEGTLNITLNPDKLPLPSHDIVTLLAPKYLF